MNLTLGIGYFGAQGTHSKGIFQYINEDTSRYVDLTAGGNGIPFQICVTKKIPVTTNDIGYHSYICAKTVLCEEPLEMEDKDIIEKFLTFDEYKPGMIAKLNSYDWLSTSYRLMNLKPECIAYIDTIATKNKNTPIVLAALGKFLLGTLTFRGMVFSNKLANHVSQEDLEISDIRDIILKNIKYFTEKQKLIDPDIRKLNYCSWNDTSSFVKEYNFDNALVYMDPAWPWDGSLANNPYFLSSVVIPTILLQSDNPEVTKSLKPWGFGQKETILNDIKTWVENPLNKGAQQVIVNTQDTNYPNPINEVEPFLKEHFKIKEYFDWKAFTALNTKDYSFKEFCWILVKKEDM